MALVITPSSLKLNAPSSHPRLIPTGFWCKKSDGSDIYIPSYTIGIDEPEAMVDHIKNEFEYGIAPFVGGNNKGNVRNQGLERYAALMIGKLIKHHGKGFFEIVRDGCTADNLYSERPEDVMCLGAQIKTCAHSIIAHSNGKYKYTSYAFHMQTKYTGMLMIFRCITERLTWIIPYDVLADRYGGNNLSIIEGPDTVINWSLHRVADEDIASMIHGYYEDAKIGCSLDLINREGANIPSAPPTKMEHYFNRKFSALLDSLNIEHVPPFLEYASYDRTIIKARVQEKVACKPYQSSPAKIVYGHQVNTKTGTRKKHRPYEIGTFRFLTIFLQEPFDDYFYFIPASKLIEMEVFHDAKRNIKGKVSFHVYPPVEKDRRIKKQPRDVRANEFFLSFQDPDLRGKLMAIYNREMAL